MIATILWSLFAIVILVAVIDGIRAYRMSIGEQLARDHQPDVLRGKVERVAVHSSEVSHDAR